MRILFSIISLIISLMATAQVNITANGMTKQLTLTDNAATKALKEQLANGAVKVNLRDYGGFEKVGELPHALPADDRRLTTTTGDVMLYLGRNIVIFYGSNTWEYTPLGKIEGASADDLKTFLRGNPAEVTLTLTETALPHRPANIKAESIYDLNGKLIEESIEKLPSGVYIINGKKVIK